MKKIIILLFVFPLWGFGGLGLAGLYAQKELWGVNSGYPGDSSPPPFGYPPYFGNITKYDINGENPEMIHEFDGLHGLYPQGRLFMASNGKLYGTATQGGINETMIPNFIENAYGVIYEFDPILNKFRVVYNFDATIFPRCPRIGFIEPIPGKLYGATANRLITYDINTEVTTITGHLDYLINSELMKASDGNIYGTVIFEPQNCPNSSSSSPPYNGSIIKINPINNSINIIYSLDCNWEFGAKPSGELVEASPGKLYGTTYLGGLSPGGTVMDDFGVLFEFNILTNTYTKKKDFDNFTLGKRPYPLAKGSNGKLYGVCESGGGPTVCDPSPADRGTLFSYEPSTNTIEAVYTFAYCGDQVRYPSSLMKTSNGYFMGTIPNGALFKYDATTNTITMPDYSNVICPCPNLNNASNLIEICRKPSYHEITTTTFTPCVGSAFTYDIQNTNATSYAWSQNGTVLPTQTTGTLTIPSIAITDNGSYTCTMTNECGTTVTMPLQISASCLSVDDITANNNSLKLYPNPARNILNIKLPDNKNFDIQKITITNMLGQQVYSDTKNFTKVEVSKLPIGIYEVVLKTDKGDWSGKFVKE
jgi:hypothetical protein